VCVFARVGPGRGAGWGWVCAAEEDLWGPGERGLFWGGEGGLSKSVYDVLVRIFGNWI